VPDVPTGARGNQAALKRIACQEAILIVINHHVLELPQDHLPYGLRQMIIQRIPVYLKSVILAMRTSLNERLVGILRQGCMKSGPTAMLSPHDLATDSRVSTQARDQLAQLGSDFGVTAGAACKQFLEAITAHLLGAYGESTLPVPYNRQQLAEGYDCVTVFHGSPLESDLRLDPVRLTGLF
jgi:hypothetical protein